MSEILRILVVQSNSEEASKNLPAIAYPIAPPQALRAVVYAPQSPSTPQ